MFLTKKNHFEIKRYRLTKNELRIVNEELTSSILVSQSFVNYCDTSYFYQMKNYLLLIIALAVSIHGFFNELPNCSPENALLIEDGTHSSSNVGGCLDSERFIPGYDCMDFDQCEYADPYKWCQEDTLVQSGVWYKFYVGEAETAVVAIGTVGTCPNPLNNSQIALYSDEGETLVRANDNRSQGYRSSRLQFYAESNQYYWLLVDGFMGEEGNFDLILDIRLDYSPCSTCDPAYVWVHPCHCALNEYLVFWDDGGMSFSNDTPELGTDLNSTLISEDCDPTVIGLSGAYNDENSCYNGADVWCCLLPKTGCGQITVTPIDEMSSDLALCLLDEDFNHIDSEDSTYGNSDSEVLVFENLIPGKQYRFGIEEWNGYSDATVEVCVQYFEDCDPPGCLDQSACNYDYYSTNSEGCEYTSCICCTGDVNFDGVPQYHRSINYWFKFWMYRCMSGRCGW